VTVGAVVPAAGAGTRLGSDVPKALRELAGEPLLLHAVRRLRDVSSVGPVVVAAPPADVGAVADLLGGFEVTVVSGGQERQDSVRLGLAALPASCEHVLVHDAARALVPVAVVEAVVRALLEGAAAVVPVLPVADTVKRVVDDVVVRTLDRSELRSVQTPQGFRRDVLERAHSGGGPVTDDAAMVEALGVEVVTVPGAPEAFKVTTPFDLLVAEAVLARG
jgi:2-C-methyl-D-erythritol 4-phosphate cytidylyltransferase